MDSDENSDDSDHEIVANDKTDVSASGSDESDDEGHVVEDSVNVIGEANPSDENLSDSNSAADLGSDADCTEVGESLASANEQTDAPNLTTTNTIPELVKIIPRTTGPIETLITLGNGTFKLGLHHWSTAASMEHDRALLVETARMEAAEGTKKKSGGAKTGSKKEKKGSKKTMKKSSKKSSTAANVGSNAPKELSQQELFAIEEKHTLDAKLQFRKALTLYQRARRLCLQSTDGIQNEFYIAATINAAECHLRLGETSQSESLLSPVLVRIDTPFAVGGAAQVASKELLLEVTRVWWPALFPPEPKVKKGKRGSKKGLRGKKKGGKKGGKKKGSKKKKK
eukprot:m.232120 g.232120  ORF g.232120 m.232120 type:complete len:340 (+) comp19268_c0_seq6:378-1397(+)